MAKKGITPATNRLEPEEVEESGRPGALIHLSLPVKILLVTAAAYLFSTVIGKWWLAAEPSFETIWALSPQAFVMLVKVSITILVGIVSIYMMVYRPLQGLSRVMSEIRHGNFLVRADVAGHSELSRIAEDFNYVLANLTTVEAQKIETEQDLIISNKELRLKSEIEKRNKIIEQTNERLQSLVRDLSLLYDVGQGVSSTIELDELYRIISNLLQQKLKLQEFAILLMEEDRSKLRVKVAHGFKNPDEILNLSFHVGEGVSGSVAQLGEMIYVKDTREDPRYLYYRGEKEDDGSLLSMPLRYKKEVFGVINFSRPGIDSFSENEINLLKLIASQISLAIANAKLFTKTRELSVRDELTGLYNRRYFQQVIQLEWKRAVRFHRAISLVMIDVDYFKRYNDTHGHLEGDRLLKRLGQILMSNLREVDTSARFGGEEFIVLLPDTDRAGAMAVSEKLRRLVESERFVNENSGEITRITISVGVAVYPDDVRDIEDLIDHADIALYEAKDAGRNRVVYYPEISSRVESLSSKVPGMTRQASS